MDIEEKTAQLLISFRFGNSEFSDYMIKKGWGGIHLSIWDHTEAESSQAMIEEFQRRSKIPLFITFDSELGVGQTIHKEATEFTSLMGIAATGDENLAYEVARITAVEARWIGLNWTFSPVTDVNTNPLNPSCNTRSFSDDATVVAKFASAQVKGYQKKGLIATSKHFPGQGGAGVDSHHNLEKIELDRETLEKDHLYPFRKCITAGVETIMTHHAIYPALDEKFPATLSYAIITNLLRKQIEFKGIIIADCLEMKAISDNFTVEDAVVKSLQAGCDMILTGNDMERSLFAVVDAIKKGRLTEAQIDKKLSRIFHLKKKYRVAQSSKESYSLDQHTAFSRKLSNMSITIKGDGSILPLSLKKEILVIEPISEAKDKVKFGVHSKEYELYQLISRIIPTASVIRIGSDISLEDTYRIPEEVKKYDSVVISTIFRTAAGQIGFLSKSQIDLIRKICHVNPNNIVIIGNPYITLKEMRLRIITYSASRYSLESALAIIFDRSILD